MKLERIISIIMLLLQKEKVTAKELSAFFEVSLRTIYRDIESINMAGIPIITTVGPNGGIAIMEQYKIDKGIFTKQELIHILMGTGALDQNFGSQERASTRAKIEALIPAEFKAEVMRKASKLSLNFLTFTDACLSQTIAAINEAINWQQTICFYYWTNQKEGQKREIEPYQLIFQSGYWYVQGYCLQKQAMRIFKLSRLWGLDRTNTTFEQRKSADGFNEYNKSMAAQSMNVELKVNHTILNRLLDLCSREQITENTDGTYKVLFPFIPSDYDYGILLSLGSACECMAPVFVRQELKRRIELLAELYQAGNTENGCN